jgi:hypothetical protein
MTIQVTGLLDAQRWAVDIDGGSVARPNEREEVAWKSGGDVTRVDTDTITIHLTAAEVARFMKDLSGDGVVVLVSDGTRIGYASFS